MRLIMKLEVPGERPNRRLDAMAVIAGLVRAQTVVPELHLAVHRQPGDDVGEALVLSLSRGHRSTHASR